MRKFLCWMGFHHWWWPPKRWLNSDCKTYRETRTCRECGEYRVRQL